MKSASKTTTKVMRAIPRTPGDGPVHHPGEILRELYLADMGLTQGAAAERLGTTIGTVSQIVRGKRAITADMAIKLEALTGYGAEAWLALQARWDLAEARKRAKHVA